MTALTDLRDATGPTQRLLTSIDEMLGPMGDGLVAFNREFRFIYWSRVMEQISGITAREVLGRLAFDAFPFIQESDRNGYLREALAGRHATSKLRRYEIPETGRSGWFDAYYAPLACDGIVVAGTAVVRDITKEKLAQEQLRETESRFTNMADSSPVMLWMTSTDSLCNFFNQTWLDFTGRTLDQERGVGWAEGVHHEDFQRCMDTFIAAFNERRAFEMEYRLRRRDGAYRWLLDRGVPRFGPDGVFEGFIGSCVDITDGKEREAALREGVCQRDEFLSIASHELRTPLTALQLQMQWLERALLQRAGDDGVLREPRRFAERVRSAAAQTTRLARLVDVLLDVSRLSGGALELDVADVDLGALAAEVALQLRPSLEAAGCRIDVRAEHTVGRWDQQRLGQVVTNLIFNAAKYGAGKPIEVDVAADDNHARLRVRDHGIGIPAVDQTRIFERFGRAVPSSHYGGFGLGLWISREIVAAHGGTITVESQPGEGASFTVTLPMRERPEITQAAE